jgi:hypothetical protein
MENNNNNNSNNNNNNNSNNNNNTAVIDADRRERNDNDISRDDTFSATDYWYYVPSEDIDDHLENENSNNDNDNDDDEEETYNGNYNNNNNINIIIGTNVQIDDPTNINVVNIIVNTLLGINVMETMNLITNKTHEIDIREDENEDNFVLNGDTCPVCLDDYAGNVMILKECKHTFHETCAKSWFRDQRTCPLCRTICYHASIIKSD